MYIGVSKVDALINGGVALKNIAKIPNPIWHASGHLVKGDQLTVLASLP